MKLEESTNSTDINHERSLRDRILIDGEVELIEKYISSDNSLGCVFAISACIKHKICTEVIKEALLNLQYSTMHEFCVWVSDLAIAALDILGIQEYQGTDDGIKELIKSPSILIP